MFKVWVSLWIIFQNDHMHNLKPKHAWTFAVSFISWITRDFKWVIISILAGWGDTWVRAAEDRLVFTGKQYCNRVSYY